MAYTKHIWANDSDPYLAEGNLNEMEQGIYDAHNDAVSARNVAASGLTTATNITFAETVTYTLATWIQKIIQKLLYVQGQLTSYSQTTHVHGNISSAGAIGSTAGYVVITTADGVLTTESALAISRGGTGATAKKAAKTNLGITYGTAAPSGGVDGDIYFKYEA